MGCFTEVDVSNNPKYQLGYKVNQVYVTKKSFNLIQFEHVKKYEDKDLWHLENREGDVEIGTKIQITKLLKSWCDALGTYLKVQGIIIDGKYKGYKVNIDLISKGEMISNIYYPLPDNELLELIQD
jgi:hypothetical protein